MSDEQPYPEDCLPPDTPELEDGQKFRMMSPDEVRELDRRYINFINERNRRIQQNLNEAIKEISFSMKRKDDER